MGNGGDRSSSTYSDCDVGLGLKMQAAAAAESSYPCKRAVIMPHLSPFHHQLLQQQQQQQLGVADTFLGGSGGDGSTGAVGGGSHFFNSANNQVFAALNDIYDAAVAPGAGGGMRAPFTTSQWNELERQKMIFKHLTASNSVPAELLLPLSRNPTNASPLSQSNTSALDLKFSTGSDPEPWRCRRTDGKKWRCSRDVAPDQKYCERHAHKSRPRSRKHVEIQAHNANASTNYSQHHHPLLPGDANNRQLLQKQVSKSPTMGSATTYDQTRSIEWYMRGGTGTIPVSTCNQQQRQQQPMQSSSRMGLNRDNTTHENKTMSVLQQQYEDKQETIPLMNPYIYSSDSSRGLENFHDLNGQYCNPFLDPKITSSQGSLNAETTSQTTRHFIDAWSSAEKGGLDEISNGNKGSISSSRKLPFSSLTLSMSGGNSNDEENEQVEMGIGMMESERSNFETMRSQWTMSPVSWTNSAPGGPLGEALCLGIASSTKGASNLPSPHGYSNSSTASSCSKGSCEDGSYQFNFIG